MLSLGQVHAPITPLGGEEDAFATVKVLGKYSLTPERIREIIDVLQTNLSTYERVVEGRKEE